MRYFGNAFSLGMLEIDDTANLLIISMTQDEVSNLLHMPFTSVVGHADTAALLSSLLGHPIAFNRVSVVLKEDDMMIVAQYNGPRLPEGATELPPGAAFKYYMVMYK